MVTVFYRQVYNCDTESERSLSWSEHSLIYTVDTNKWWRITGGAYVEVSLINVSAPVFSDIALSKLAPTASFTVTASHSATVNRRYTIASGLTLSIGSGAIFRIQ